MRHLALWTCLAYVTSIVAQLSNGTFGLVTTDPVCVQCDYALVQWYGGTAPYVLSVSGQKNRYKIANVGVASTNQMRWHVNFPTGTQLWFQLRDGNSTAIYTNIVTVGSSSDASCVDVPNPLVTDSSATSSGLATTTPSTSSVGAVGATSSPNPGDSEPSSSGSTGAILGGVVAGVVALLLLLVLAFWWRRKSDKKNRVLGSKNSLDLVEDRNGTIVEPFVPATGALQSGSNTASQSASTKARGHTPANFSSTNIESSSTEPSANAPSSSASQSVHDVPLSSSRPSTARRKHARSEAAGHAPIQETDAGVRVMGGVPPEPATLPPAYDHSWRE